MLTINRINALIFLDSRDMLGLMMNAAANMWLIDLSVGLMEGSMAWVEKSNLNIIVKKPL